MQKNDLYTFEFALVCSVAFLALCNISAFYNFHLYLQQIGFNGKQAGFLIGLYSLTAMVLYILGSKHIKMNNALACIQVGMFVVAGCGVAYLFADQFWSLAIVRIANGAGVFLVMAACMVVLVEIIPGDKSGLAFSLYSVALLSPYAIMPAVSELFLPMVSSPTRIYFITAVLLLMASGFLPMMRTRINQRGTPDHAQSKATRNPHDGRRRTIRRPAIYILLVNAVYFTIFSALFFLFEGLGLERGVENPGLFFTVQMAVMIAIRLFGSHMFDKYSKVAMVIVAMLITAAGFLLLKWTLNRDWIFPIAAVFGLGMGLCVPPLNSLMYLVTEPQYRGYNANMMMLSIHLGTFLGPFFGAWIIDASGYDLFLLSAFLLTIAAAGFFYVVNPGRYILHEGAN